MALTPCAVLGFPRGSGPWLAVPLLIITESSSKGDSTCGKRKFGFESVKFEGYKVVR